MARSAMLAGRATSDLIKNFILLLVVIGIGYLVGFSFKNGFVNALAMIVLVMAVAATIDRSRLDTLRAEQMALADTASKRITDAVGRQTSTPPEELHARARDVQMLFADASTGAHSPALVRQGQISELIAHSAANTVILTVAALLLVTLGLPVMTTTIVSR